MISWPDDLVSSIARRRSVIFLGAGISMHSVNENNERPPSWEGFLRSGIDRCTTGQQELRGLLRSGDYLGCCQLLKYKLSHDWIPLVEEKFLDPNYHPAEIHKSILKLDSPIVATPNFDKIYDNYATAETENLLKIKKYYDDDLPRTLRSTGKQRLILKVHGCIDTPDKLIFTREDYADIRSKYANFYRSMDALLLTQTFLFIGCGMNDPDLALLLEQYARSFGAAPPHYLTLSGRKSAEYIKMLEDNYNLRVLKYSANDHHKELVDSVAALAQAVEKRRDEIAQSFLW